MLKIGLNDNINTHVHSFLIYLIFKNLLPLYHNRQIDTFDIFTQKNEIYLSKTNISLNKHIYQF